MRPAGPNQWYVLPIILPNSNGEDGALRVIHTVMSGFREAFPDLNLWGGADLTAGRRLCGRPLGGRRSAHWPGLQRFPRRFVAGGDRPQNAFTGTMVLRIENGKIAGERSVWTTA
jgi:hypothetical protein